MNSPDKLGRGLEALLGSLQPQLDQPELGNVRMIAIEKLRPGPFQPRTKFSEESIKELADSITAHGIIQPIVARASGDGSYDIITGERRWRAAQMAAQHEVPVIVRSLADQDAMALALIENIQREDLNVTEIASLLKRLASEFAMTHAQIATNVGISRASVTNLLRILTLEDIVLKMLEQGDIEAGHAKVLLALSGKDQVAAAQHVVANELSVRKTEELIKNWHKRTKPRHAAQTKSVDADIAELERRLSERLTAKVSIHDRNGKGHIKINYHSLDELDGVLQRIG